MSTKIYSGILFSQTTLEGVYEAATPWRQEVERRGEAAIKKFFAHVATRVFDGRCLQPIGFVGRVVDGSPLSVALADFRDDRARIARGEHGVCDVDFSLTIYPHQGRVYGMMFCHQPDWREDFMAFVGAVDYSYWDNEDRPEGVTRREWRERDANWDIILGPDGIPNRSGLVMEMKGKPWYLPNAAEVLAYVPSVEDRIRMWTRDRVAAERAGDVRSMEPREAYGKIAEAMRWSNTDEGREAQEAWVEPIREYLKPELFREDLLTDPADRRLSETDDD